MPEMTLVLLGMVTNEGMAKRLDPNADTMGELARYLGPRLRQAVPEDGRRIARGSRTWPRSPLDALRVTGAKAKVIIARPRRTTRSGRITARYLSGGSSTAPRKDR